MFCGSCGKKISDHAKFCPYCGAKVERTEETPAQENKVGQAQQKPATLISEEQKTTEQPVTPETVQDNVQDNIQAGPASGTGRKKHTLPIVAVTVIAAAVIILAIVGVQTRRREQEQDIAQVDEAASDQNMGGGEIQATTASSEEGEEDVREEEISTGSTSAESSSVSSAASTVDAAAEASLEDEEVSTESKTGEEESDLPTDDEEETKEVLPDSDSFLAMQAAMQEVRDAGGTPVLASTLDVLPLLKSGDMTASSLEEIPQGRILSWDGTTAESSDVTGDKLLYHVYDPESGLDGYADSWYLPEVFYPMGNEEQLGIVETDDAAYSYDTMTHEIDALCAAYPDLLSAQSIGTSVDHRDIPMLIMGNPDADIKIMIQAGIHGCEYMTSQMTMKLIEYYCYNYDRADLEGTSYRTLLDNTGFYIVPMANPDGCMISLEGEDGVQSEDSRALLHDCYERDKDTLVELHDILGQDAWYDNYRGTYTGLATVNTSPISFEEYLTQWKANANGVDLNNNFDAEWENLKVKDEPSFSNYRGSAALSEPESRALVAVAQQYDFSAFISYHARGNLIYYNVPGSSEEVSNASIALADLIHTVNGNKLVPMSTALRSGTVNLGGFNDWIQLSVQRPGLTIEIGKYACPLTIDEFMPSYMKNRETWAVLAKNFYQEGNEEESAKK